MLDQLRHRLRPSLHKYRAKAQIRRASAHGLPIRVVAGASDSTYADWISTQKEFLDITSSSSFSKFLGRGRIDRLLLEHVVEHLTRDEFEDFLRIARDFLQPDGRIRIAVPDAYHPSPWYREQMGVAGLEPGADDHKTFWSIDDMREACSRAGYVVLPLEFFDQTGRFKFVDYDESEGYVSRSRRRYDGRLVHDAQLQKALFEGLDSATVSHMREVGITYTSLIVDLALDHVGHNRESVGRA